MQSSTVTRAMLAPDSSQIFGKLSATKVCSAKCQ
jgi:hypothetical protein